MATTRLPRPAMASAPLLLAAVCLGLLVSSSGSAPATAAAAACASASAAGNSCASASAAGNFCASASAASAFAYSSASTFSTFHPHLVAADYGGLNASQMPHHFCRADAGAPGFCPDDSSARMVHHHHGLLTRVYATSASSLADAPAPHPCQPGAFANILVLVCAGSSAKEPAEECCSTLLQVDMMGNLRCLCAAASGPEMLNAGYTVADVLGWYSGCGGRLHVDDLELASTCQSVSVAHSVAQPADSLAVSPPPPPTVTATQTAATRPLVVVVADPQRSPAWPWWGVLAAIAVVMLSLAIITLICVVGCGRILRWLSDLLLYAYRMGRNSVERNSRRANSPASCHNMTRDIVPDTDFQDQAPNLSDVRDLVPTGERPKASREGIGVNTPTLSDPRPVIGRPLQLEER